MTSGPCLPLPETPGQEPAPALAAMRRGLGEAVRGGMWKTVPPPEERTIGGVRVLRHAAKAQARGAIVHFHGGGFRMGAPETVAPYARMLADRCRVDVYCPAYRLAPDHPFPAGLNDGWSVVDALAVEYGPRLILAGDSAGGGLAASLAACCGATGRAPAGLILHSPWLDLTVSSASYAANAETDPLFSRQAAEEAAALYLQGRYRGDDARVSPLFAETRGFPPTLITVGSGEVLLHDSTSFYEGLHAAGVTALLNVIEGMDHVAVTRDLSLPGAAVAFEATVEFVARLLA